MVKGKINDAYPLALVQGDSVLGNSGAFEVLLEGDRLIYSKLGGAGHLSEEKVPQLLEDIKAAVEGLSKE